MIEGKKILVIGVARSGLASGQLAMKLGGLVTFNDSKADPTIDHKDLYEQANWDLGGPPQHIETYDMVILSPGVPTDLPFIDRARQAGVEVIGALEFGYRYTPGHYYAITGTNGKTTTTQLTYEIFAGGGLDAHAVGNIGYPVSSVGLKGHQAPHMITEVSSFQLESIVTFRPRVAAFLNIKPDHLNRHKTLENYFQAKCRIYENQEADDYLLLNYDDQELRAFKPETSSQVLYFSKTPLDRGVYAEDGKIYVHLEDKVEIMPVDEIKIVGDHNLENVLAAVGIAYLGGVSPQVIRRVVAAYRGVEHRIEYVGAFHGVDCYNDSKGTNPDATMVAVKAMAYPTVLIAGGMDKGSDFDELSLLYQGRLSNLILLGETKEQMKQAANKAGFKQVILVDNMEEAVEKAFEMANNEGRILLSPACASWDMYESYEVRGRDFKTCIEKVKL